jgi:LysR family hydrogen peroxide-inducible transcriptional activator
MDKTMNLRDFDYFIKLADLKHFGRAADACFVSQPTLSMQIKKLEDELGVTLFERQKKQVILTEAGKELLPYAQSTLNTVSSMKKAAQSLNNPLSGSITLSAIQSLAPYLLPHLMPALSKSFPYIKWRLQEGKTDQLLEQLHKGDIDAALLALPIPSHQLEIIPLFKEPFSVAIGSEHPLYKSKAFLSLKKLEQEPWLLLEEGHCLRDQALELCHMNQSTQNDYRAASLETLRYTVAHHDGMTLMPLLACLPTKGLKYIPLKDASAQREIALVYRKSAANAALLKTIAESIQKNIQPRLNNLKTKLKP